MKTLKIGYVDFWNNFFNENLFEKILQKHVKIQKTLDHPDLLIYGEFGQKHKDIEAKRKLFWTGENTRIDLSDHDYSIGFDYIENDKYLRFPIWKYYFQLSDNYHHIKVLQQTETKNIEESKFCAFVVSGRYGVERRDFFKILNQYKTIDSFGSLYNNNTDILRLPGNTAPEWQQAKIKYLRKNNYKFIICFENSSHPGYCTEKLYDAMISNTVPIYWGDPTAYQNFNSRSFINAHNFSDWYKLREYIVELDENEQKYQTIYKQPYMTNEQIEYMCNDELERFLLKIIADI